MSARWVERAAGFEPQMVELDGRRLNADAVAAVARGDALATLSADAAARVDDGHALLRRMIADGTPIYGVTTGFGALDSKGVSAESNRAQQANLLRSHAAGVGPAMPRRAVRAMMAIRANVLASGITGVSRATLDALLAMLAADVVPEVPETGSVGACGDLAPLAHMALPLIGEGRASVAGGPWQPGGAAMAAAGIALPDIADRDGIALINGTEQTTGIGILALVEAERLVAAAEGAAALTMEAVGSLDDSFDRRVALAKGHPGQIATSAVLAHLTDGSRSVGPPRPDRLRDALALRCVPQVLGAARDTLAEVRVRLEREINAGNDNPIFGLSDGWVTSNSGNFHGQVAADALDQLANSLTSVAVMSERRAARLVDANHNGGLPAFLIHPDAPAGENSGFMIAQYTAAALVARLRMTAVPAAIQSIPTCANTEDHVPMAAHAAQRAWDTLVRARQVVAIELLLAAQAVDLRGHALPAGLQALYDGLRGQVATMVRDRVLAADIAAVVTLLENPAALTAWHREVQRAAEGAAN
jgi:histidine ammonia-lyase